MAVLKCKQCGTQLEIDENTTDKVKCSVCGRICSLEQDAPELYKKYQSRKTDLEKRLKEINEKYEQSGNDKDIRTTIESYDKYRNIPDFNVMWRDFILGATGASATRKDRELQTYLKNAAKRFDGENESKDFSLYESILMAYPNVGTNVDWDGIIKQTYGDEFKFTAISENLINYIVKSQDKAFAMDIFYLLAAKEGEWASAGRIYLRILLSSDEVAAKVFPRSAFNGRTKKFVLNVRSYCKKYLDEGNRITLDETKVWKNYTDACKYQKRRNIIIMSSVLAVILAVSLGLFFYFNKANSESIEFNVDKVIETTYGEPLDLSEYTVTYVKNSGEKVTEQITERMLVGYDPEMIGTQTVYIEFQGVRTGITIRINPATLNTPVLVQSGNYVTWDFVPYAANYNVYVDSSSTPVTTTTELSYDLSSIQNFGQLSVTVRANSDSEKYNNSAVSEALIVEKLQSPANLRYQDGVLLWDEVSSADVYELTINGSAYTSYVNSFGIELMRGENEIMVIAKSDNAAIDGITVQTLYLLSPVSADSVAYSGDRVSWGTVEKASIYSVYVNGEFWKDFTRNYFSVSDDQFDVQFGDDLMYTIGIVCKSSMAGIAPSEMVSFGVAIGDTVSMNNGLLSWTPLGSGAAYFISINGEFEVSLENGTVFSVSDGQWNEGNNTLAITANLDGQTVFLRTVTILKQLKPSVSVSGGSWRTEGNENDRFKVGGSGEWVTEDQLPDLTQLTAGDYTVSVKRTVSSPSAFEIESDVYELKLIKPNAPRISVTEGELNCTNLGSYNINLYYAKDAGGAFIRIASLGDIREAGEHQIKATLSATDIEGYDYVIESDFSEVLTVSKLQAPTISYTEGQSSITCNDVGNIKFYYMYDGEEYELAGGLIENLGWQGSFTIYARRVAAAENELNSENSNGVQVFNMNIALSINPAAGSQTQLNVIFSNCTDIDSLTFSYELRFYNQSGEYIGNKTSPSDITVQKKSNPDVITTSVNYRSGAIINQGHSITEIWRIELIVIFSNGANTQTLTAETHLN